MSAKKTNKIYKMQHGMSDLDLFKNKLTKELNEQKVSAHELAQRANVTAPSIYRFMTGETVPGLKTASKIANALGYSLSEFLQPENHKDHSIKECYRRICKIIEKELKN